MSVKRKIKAFACFDCDNITTGYIERYARDKPLKIYLDRDVALQEQRIIVGDAYEVEIVVKRKIRD